MGFSYSHSSHRAIAYSNVRPKHKLYWGVWQVVRLKCGCTGTKTIIKCDYEIDYVNVDMSGRRNRQCNSVLIVKVKKTKEQCPGGLPPSERMV
jgi:hypothetical protein